MNPKPVGVDLELIMLVDRGETGFVQIGEEEVMALPFIMQLTDQWRVYGLEPP